MAANEKEGVYEFTGFRGLRNGIKPERFELTDLEVAMNVDIDDSLAVSRRKGYSEPTLAGTYHSVWSAGSVCLAVRNETDLVLIAPDYSFSTIRTGLTPEQPMSYAVLGTRVGYSNGLENGVVEQGQSRTWGIAPPPEPPTATAVGGTLPSGRYLFAVTFARVDGQESGTPSAGSIDVLNGGLVIDLPTSTDPGVAYVNVYVSRRDGEDLYYVGRVPNGTTALEYSAPTGHFHRLTTQFLSAPPPGQRVAAFNGRSLVASGAVLFYSEPYAYELFDLRKNFPFLDPITLVAPMETGVYLGTVDEVFWLAGRDPAQWNLDTRFAYGAIPGTADYCTADMIFEGKGSGPALIFHSTQGVCVGLDGGSITNITQGRFDIPAQERGAGVLRRHNGMVQYVSVLQGEGGTVGNTAQGAASLPELRISAQG